MASEAIESDVGKHCPALPIPEGLRHAVCEVERVRHAMEHAFEQIHAHVGPAALDSVGYLVAMQSADALGQTLAAIETFLSNIAGAIGAGSNWNDAIDVATATRGITLSAVTKRLAPHENQSSNAITSGSCDFF
jgi:hypothetical protein